MARMSADRSVRAPSLFHRRGDLAAVVGDDEPFAGAFHPDVGAAELDIADAFDGAAVGHNGGAAVDRDLVVVGFDHVGIGGDPGEVLCLGLDLAALSGADVIIGDESGSGLFIALELGKCPSLVHLDQFVLDTAFFILPKTYRRN